MTPIAPMLAGKCDWDRIGKYQGYWMEPKLDGVRGIVAKDDDDGVKIWTRGNNDIADKLPHLVKMFEAIPGSFVLDGELGYDIAFEWAELAPVIDFNLTMRVIGSGPDNAIIKQGNIFHESGRHLRFFAFDMLGNGYDDFIAGVVPNIDRRNELADWRNVNIDSLPHSLFDLTDMWPAWDEDLYTRYVAMGGEGMMLKNPHAEYWPGKRYANTWYKVKAFDSIDVVVAGYTEGMGKFEGQIGAIQFGAYEGRGPNRRFVWLGRCSGMDDATRAEISNNKDLFLNQVFELRHFGKVGIDGAGLRFPQFLRWRPDKPAGECKL